jgi:hypothetical protein
MRSERWFSKVLVNFAEYNDGRRKMAKANKKLRSRKRLAASTNSSYQKELAEELLPFELEKIVAERLQRINQINIE